MHRLAAALVCLLGIDPLIAQTLPPQLPSSAEPGREAPKPVEPMPSLSAPTIAVPPSTASQAPAGAAATSFELKHIAIEGATAFSAEALRPLYAGLIGQRIAVAQAFDVANQIELRYRNAGFVTTRVLVPEQTIDQGRFRIVVVEGFVADIVYEADIGPARAAVERLIAPLRGVRPISVGEIERRLLLSNDLPGLTVRATLEPSPTVLGGSVILVRAERKAFDALVGLDNRNSPYLGRAAMSAGLDWNALGARADHLSLYAGASAPLGRSTTLGASYDALVSDNGLTFGLTASHVRSHPGRELEVLNVRSRVTASVATLTYPLIRSREQNLRAVGQFEWRNVDTDIGGTAFTRDRLRIVRLGLSYDRSDSWNGITALRGTLHKGLSGLGATPEGSALASRVNGHSDFLKLTLDLTRLQQLGERTSLAASVTSQYSNRALLASEEIGLGGASFGRAYDDGEIAADNGAAASLELRYTPRMPAGPVSHIVSNAQFYGFVDGGRVWAASNGAPVDRPSLSSFGGGVRADLSHGLFLRIEAAKPISAQVKTQGNKHARVFVSLSAQF